MKKEIAALMLTLVCAMPLASVEYVYAAGSGTNQKTEQRRPPKRRVLTADEKAMILEAKYNMSKEKANTLAKRSESFRDVERAVTYAALSGRSENELLAMNQKEPWSRIQYKLGISPGAYSTAMLLARADRLSRWWGMDEEEAKQLLKEGYPMHWIKIAWVLSHHSDWMVRQILDSRTKDMSWKEWAASHLTITPETYDTWIEDYKNPAYIPGTYF